MSRPYGVSKSMRKLRVHKGVMALLGSKLLAVGWTHEMAENALRKISHSETKLNRWEPHAGHCELSSGGDYCTCWQMYDDLFEFVRDVERYWEAPEINSLMCARAEYMHGPKVNNNYDLRAMYD